MMLACETKQYYLFNLYLITLGFSSMIMHMITSKLNYKHIKGNIPLTKMSQQNHKSLKTLPRYLISKEGTPTPTPQQL